MLSRPRVLYQGLLRSPASWARVGRGLIEGLLALDVSVAAVASRGFLHDDSFGLPAGLEVHTPSEADSQAPFDVGVGCLHPPHLHRMMGKFQSLICLWEADRIPTSWIEILRENPDQLVAPSQFMRDRLQSAGIAADRIALVPFGSDAKCSRLDGGSRPCTFLSVLAPHWRKGVRELLTAFGRAFSADDDVALKIKTTYDPSHGRKHQLFEIPSWSQVLSEAGLQCSGAPRVELDTEQRTDEEMIELYRSSDVYVAPSWGEAFGLAILDALKSGLPAIVTGWGGHMDFHPQPDDQLSFALEERAEGVYEPSTGARVAVPDIDELVARLRWHAENRAESAALGREAAQALAGWTWRQSAQEFLGGLP